MPPEENNQSEASSVDESAPDPSADASDEQQDPSDLASDGEKVVDGVEEEEAEVTATDET